MTVETNPNYWDCECETNFIHAKSKTLACSLCGMTEDESPDFRVNEIKGMNDLIKSINNIREYLKYSEVDGWENLKEDLSELEEKILDENENDT